MIIFEVCSPMIIVYHRHNIFRKRVNTGNSGQIRRVGREIKCAKCLSGQCLYVFIIISLKGPSVRNAYGTFLALKAAKLG